MLVDASAALKEQLSDQRWPSSQLRLKHCIRGTFMLIKADALLLVLLLGIHMGPDNGSQGSGVDNRISPTLNQQ